MKKSDLKSGMILETRRGKRYLFINNEMLGVDGFLRFSSYYEDLKNKIVKDYDVIKVYKRNQSKSLQNILEDKYLTLIWERKEIELTKEQIKILKALKTLGFNYIARDKDYDLYAHMNKPHKDNIEWNNDSSLMPLDFLTVGFDFIKWSDDDPTKIDDLL